MKFAVAVVSPPGYPHSAAFFEVALTVAQGLLSLGHDAIISSLGPGGAGPTASLRRHIVLGAHLAPRAGIPLPPDAILYNLEQIDGDSKWLTPELLDLYRRHPVWDYSSVNAARLAARGVPIAAVVPIGYVPALTRIEAPKSPPDIDVLFYGSLNQRRRRVLDTLTRRGARVEAVFGVYGAERDALIARAKVVLNVHYYEAKVFEIVRVSYLLANRKAVVSETGADRAEEAAFAQAVSFAEYDHLANTCLALLADGPARVRQADAGFAHFSQLKEADLLSPALAKLGPMASSNGNGQHAPEEHDPWAGSRPVRVLMVPELTDASDRHESALGALAEEMGHLPNVTIGIALPPSALGAVPPSIARAANHGEGDLLLLERPASDDQAGWERLFSRASLFVATAAQPELRRMAQTMGLTIAEMARPAREPASGAR